MLSVLPVPPVTTEHDTDADLLSWKIAAVRTSGFRAGIAQKEATLHCPRPLKTDVHWHTKRTPDRALVMSWYTNLSGLRTIRIASASPYTARYSRFVHQFCAKICSCTVRVIKESEYAHPFGLHASTTEQAMAPS